MNVWREAKRRSQHMMIEGPNVFVVVRACGYDKDDYLFAYLREDQAYAHRDRLNGEPYDIDGAQDFRVYEIPLGNGL